MGRLFYFMSLFARPVLMTKAANEPVASRRKGGCVVQRTDDNNNDRVVITGQVATQLCIQVQLNAAGSVPDLTD